MEARLFKNNTNQAVRLPKPLEFPHGIKAVDIIALGRARLIVPVEDSWDQWFDTAPETDDFLLERDQGSDQRQDIFS